MALDLSFMSGGGALAPVVHRDAELERILSLPSRTWDEKDPKVWRLVFEMSAYYRLPGALVTMRPAQAVALAELHHYRRLLGPLRVGAGKTLITFLAPLVFGAKRPVLVIPGKLRKKTERDFAKLRKHWRAPESLTTISVEQISLDYGEEFLIGNELVSMSLLDLADPDLLITDECHRFKNIKTAACAMKMDRFMRKRPWQPRVDLSGSFTRESIKDHAHIDRWNLKELCPVPTTPQGIDLWSRAIDVNVPPEDRVQVGALLALASEEERRTLDPITAARRGFRRRFMQTPGVVSFGSEYAGASLLVREFRIKDNDGPYKIRYSDATEEAFKKLFTECKLPDETPTSGGLENWAQARNLARGFYRHMDPLPPVPWRDARRAWYAAVREIIRWSGDKRPFDSLKQVALGLNHKSNTGPLWDTARATYEQWKQIEPTHDIKTVTIWYDMACIDAIVKWMDARRGIVFVDHIDIGEKLAEITGKPYYHKKGIDKKTRRFIEDALPERDGSIIASMESNKEGQNLQAYSEALWVDMPGNADSCEQLLGRLHRDGQRSDEVTVDVMLLCRPDVNAWLKILEQSPFIVNSSPLGAKILSCSKDMPDDAEIEARSGTWRMAA